MAGLSYSIKNNYQTSIAIAPKQVTTGGIHLYGLAPGQHRSEKRRSGGDWRAVDETATDLTDLGIEPRSTTL